MGRRRRLGLNVDRQKGADKSTHARTHTYENRQKMHEGKLFRKHFHFLPSANI